MHKALSMHESQSSQRLLHNVANKFFGVCWLSFFENIIYPVLELPTIARLHDLRNAVRFIEVLIDLDHIGMIQHGHAFNLRQNLRFLHAGLALELCYLLAHPLLACYPMGDTVYNAEAALSQLLFFEFVHCFRCLRVLSHKRMRLHRQFCRKPSPKSIFKNLHADLLKSSDIEAGTSSADLCHPLPQSLVRDTQRHFYGCQELRLHSLPQMFCIHFARATHFFAEYSLRMLPQHKMVVCDASEPPLWILCLDCRNPLQLGRSHGPCSLAVSVVVVRSTSALGEATPFTACIEGLHAFGQARLDESPTIELAQRPLWLAYFFTNNMRVLSGSACCCTRSDIGGNICWQNPLGPRTGVHFYCPCRN
mmetsp:Transcript_79326/g.157134  ORF Transcript_79326/g.157134 Transcript_79326/m.157134 type:complete len:364 (-) Transcript_79326:203-1294(-)